MVDSGARAISNDVQYLIWKMFKLKGPTLLVVLTDKRMQVSVVKSPLRMVIFNSRPFLAGRLVERGLLGVLALSEVSDGGDEKASCKVRIPLLPSDRVNRTFSESRMVKTLWILSSRCRPRVDVEMSTLQVSDSGLGEGDEGGTGPGLGVGDLQCRPRVDEGEASLLQVVDPGILLLEVGKGLLVDTCINLQIVAAGRYLPGLWIKDTWKLSSWWIKASVSNPLAEAFLSNDCGELQERILFSSQHI